jgi:hypothetical protein
MAWYKVGLVTVTNGATSVSAKGTKFATNARVGDGFRAPDGLWYEITNIASEFVLGIYPAYQGATEADSADWVIAPLQGYNKETADRLRYITDNIRDFSEDVTAARESAEAAKVAEIAAEASAVKAKASEDTVHADSLAAQAAAQGAAQSESNASQAQQAASLSEINAKKSETNAALSETNSADSQAAAGDSAEAARLSALAAAQSELNAATSESKAKQSETNAKVSETSAAEDASTANTDAATSTQARLDALEALRLAEKARDDAQAAANANTGQVQDLGLVDLSSGVYPARPVVSSFWYVSVGGTVTADGETIEYGAGDVLRFSKPLEKFYKIDNTESVTSVAGKTGVVQLDKSDVGLGRVDNTNDLEKPISTAVQAELDIRKPIANKTDTTAGRVVTVGGFGENGGNPILKASTDDANLINVQGTYVFTNGGLNLPTSGSYYVKHTTNQAAGYAKQVAYSVTENTMPFIRTQSAGTWASWRTFTDIVDGLDSNRADAALSANAGRLLQEQLQANNATIVQYTYSLNPGQLIISGADLSGKNLSYVPGAAIIVSLNGFSLLKDTDFTATTGESISLAKAIEEKSDVLVTVFGAFAVADHYTKAEADVLLQRVAAQSAEAVLTVKWVPSRDMIPQGAVPMDGGLYSRTTYPDAWALIRDGKVPKVTDAVWNSDLTARGSFTEGDGSTTFRVPDYNGKSSGSYQAVFIRGDGYYAGAAGTIQRDTLQGHQHAINIKASTGSTAYGNAAYGSGASSQYGTEGPLTGTGVRESLETRPINVAGVWTLRLFGSVSNVGNVDVAQIASQLNTLDNAAYKRSNAVGVVSQTGGVPTGAIIERGSNSQGSYVRYADGTQICWLTVSTNAALNNSHANGVLYGSPAIYPLAYPATFSSVPTVTASASLFGSATGIVWAVGYEQPILNQWGGWLALTTVATGAYANIRLMAIGRWY